MTRPASDVRSSAPETIKRRGLFAAGAALIAALVAKVSEERVEAADGDPVLAGNSTNSTTTTTINNSASGFSIGFAANAVGGTVNRGLQGQGSAFGVFGTSNIGGGAVGAGVFGETTRSDCYGVWGNSTPGIGVRATSDSNSGLYAESRTKNPILAQVTAGSTANTIAIYGVNNSTFDGGAPGAGGFAIYGLCAKGHGLVGATASPGAAAVVGASNGVAGAYAAAFYGSVIVGGAFTVVNGPKSAAVPHPDGSHRRLYCMESPESWFEDFGSGRLDCGRADVTLDPNFAAIVNLDDYQVFLTEYDEHSDLCVVDRTSTGFRVRSKSDEAHGRFGWRVVAKRKDISGARLEPVTIPPEPKLPDVPDVPRAQPPAAR